MRIINQGLLADFAVNHVDSVIKRLNNSFMIFVVFQKDIYRLFYTTEQGYI
jgi:hypothetical protein